MTAAYGNTPAGFVVKPTAAILADMQQAAWSSPALSPSLDLSPQTPDGQMLAIVANQAGAAWELLQIAFNQFNPQDVEGAGADNIGAIRGIPREGETYTQVYCTLTIVSGTYAAGSLLCNVAGEPGQTFANAFAVTPAMVVAGVAVGILFQATTIGPTPAVNPGTLTTITASVSGWTAVTNPIQQAQLGASEEPDALYLPRQDAELAVEGSCNPAATAAAIVALGAAQAPPQTLAVSVLENKTNVTMVQGALTLPPHTYAVVIYDGGTGWVLGAGRQDVAQTVYDNKPAGITPIGTTLVSVADPNLGQQPVSFSTPTALPLYVIASVVPRTGITLASLVVPIQAALVAAAIAPTPSTGIAPLGQLLPGAPVVASQIEAVIMGVPGVFDVQAVTFGFASAPTTSTPIAVNATQIATLIANNITVLAGSYP